MKDYLRAHPALSLCGLCCALCPIHQMQNGCPGCGGGAGHQSCSIIRCSLEHGRPEFCSQCAEFPCQRLAEAVQYDSFLPHSNLLANLHRVRNSGPEDLLEELSTREGLLLWLLQNCNDGRQKTLFRTAANLLPLDVLESAVQQIRQQIEQEPDLKKESVPRKGRPTGSGQRLRNFSQAAQEKAVTQTACPAGQDLL